MLSYQAETLLHVMSPDEGTKGGAKGLTSHMSVASQFGENGKNSNGGLGVGSPLDVAELIRETYVWLEKIGSAENDSREPLSVRHVPELASPAYGLRRLSSSNLLNSDIHSFKSRNRRISENPDAKSPDTSRRGGNIFRGKPPTYVSPAPSNSPK
jgi:hypothetical protein